MVRSVLWIEQPVLSRVLPGEVPSAVGNQLTGPGFFDCALLRLAFRDGREGVLASLRESVKSRVDGKVQEAGTAKTQLLDLRSSLTMRARSDRGFTLIETLVALVILCIALLLGMALLLQQPRVLHRLDAQRQSLRAIESTIESLRAGLLPLEDAEYDGFNTAVGASPGRDLVVAVTVEATPTVALYAVHVEARYTVAGQPRTRTVDTMLWRP